MDFLRRFALTVLLFVVLSGIALWGHSHLNYHDPALMLSVGFLMGWFSGLLLSVIWSKRPASSF